MTEFVPAARPEVKLSFEDRLYIIQTVNALPLQQFDELVFALNPPKGIIPPESAAQGSRSKALLDWVEGPTGPGLAVIDKYLQQIIPKATKTAARLTAFAISGRLGDLSTAEIEAIVQLLRQKTGDGSIDLAFFEEGSIKLVLSGSAEGLEKLQKLFESGELADELRDLSVEYAQPIDDSTTTARKARLIQALRLSRRRIDIDSYISRAQGIFRGRDLVIHRIHININQELARELARARELASELTSSLTRARDLNSRDELTLAEELASRLSTYLLNAYIRASSLTSDLAIVRSSYLFLDASFRDYTLASDLAIDLARDLALSNHLNDNSEVDLSEIDLSGANLRGINLKGVSLAGVDLTHAIVEEAIFGDNPGLSESAKNDLRRRGAIIQDTPDSDRPVLVRR